MAASGMCPFLNGPSPNWSNDVEVLRMARDRLVEDRRGLAESLAKPYDRGNTENWRVHLVEVQQAITAVDEAIKEEQLYG